MLKAGYNIKVSAGAITAGGTLGILIPPSVLLILYGATAGVSVVQLYAGAFFPGIMLAGLYVGYIIVLALWKPSLMPPLPESERRVNLPALAQSLAKHGKNALVGLSRAFASDSGVAKRSALGQLIVTLLPLLFIAAVLGVTYRVSTAPEVVDTTGVVEVGNAGMAQEEANGPVGLADESEAEVKEAPAEEAEAAGAPQVEAEKAAATEAPAAAAAPAAALERLPAPLWFWVMLGLCAAGLAVLYVMWNWERFEIFRCCSLRS